MDAQQDPHPRRRAPLELGTRREQLLTELGYAQLELVPELGSTNTELLVRLRQDQAAIADLSVLAADHQSAGRGRLDRSWQAPAGAALAVSIVLKPLTSRSLPLSTENYHWFSLLAAVAWAEAIEAETAVAVGIKWPNDLMVGERKLGGILAQMHRPDDGSPPAVVLGTGVNITLEEDELPVPTATSLRLCGAGEVDRNELLTSYLSRFVVLYSDFTAADADPDAGLAGGDSLRHRWTQRSCTLGRRVRAQLPGDGHLEGLATRLDHDGSLVIEDDRGAEHVIAAADVIHLRPVHGDDA